MSSRLAGLTSRGGAVNIGFGAAIQAVAAVQSVIIGRLLGPEILGLYALATGGVVIGSVLKDFGISQKLVQEREIDLYTAYGAAFTMEIALAGSAFVLVAGIVGPILAFAYGKPVLLPVIAVLSLSVFTTAFLYLPASIPYREMNFLRRNLILAVGPIATFAVTVPAAFGGLGIWSLAVGDLAGLAAAALVMLTVSPIRPHFVRDRALLRSFLSFGRPLWGAGLITTAAGWIATIAISAALGVQAVGYFNLAQSWEAQAIQVDAFLSDTLFPALCSIQSSMERQRRAFNYTCRLSMGWAAPVGAGMVVFASPLVHTLLGHRWYSAIFLIQVSGAGVMINSIAYSWNMFYAARGETRPTLVASAVAALWLIFAFVPLTVIFGLHGVAGAVVIFSVSGYLVRQYYLRKIFGNLQLVFMIWREWLAAGVAAAVILLAQVGGWKASGVANLFAQAAVFGAVAFGLFGFLERGLLADVLRGIRQGGGAEPSVATPVTPAGAAGPAGPTAAARVALPAGRPMSFPLLVSADPDGRTIWATTRDWPALGRLDRQTMQWAWTEFPSFPHYPSPDGEGGCWTALTRHSALAHVDGRGITRVVPLPKTRELLVTAVTSDWVWAVDAGQTKLWRVDRGDLTIAELALPGMQRPDFVVPDGRGGLWVADTHSSAVAIVEEATMHVRMIDGPHPTRALTPDPSGRGMWLGSSTVPRVTLVGWDGTVRASVELPGVPFGLAPMARGVLLVTFKDRDSAAVVRTARREISEIPLGEAAQPMGCAFSGGVGAVALAGNSEILLLPLAAASAAARAKQKVLVER